MGHALEFTGDPTTGPTTNPTSGPTCTHGTSRRLIPCDLPEEIPQFAEQNSKSKHSVRFDSLSTGGGGVSILLLVLISVFSILFCIVLIFCVYKRMHNRVQTNTKQMTEMVEATMEQESDAEPEATDNVTVCTDTNDTPVPPQNQTKI